MDGEPGLNANPIEMDKPDFTTRFIHDESMEWAIMVVDSDKRYLFYNAEGR